MNRIWIVVLGCLGFATMMSLRVLASSGVARAAIAAAAFGWAAIAVILAVRKAS